MATVQLKTIIGGNKREFDLVHANAIFDVQSKNPPKTWQLADDNYIVSEGKIVAKSDTQEVETSDEEEEIPPVVIE